MEFKTKIGATLADEILDDDRTVNELLIESKFSGPISEAVVAKLWMYGYRVTISLIRSDRVFEQCATLGRPVERSHHWSLSEESIVFELATDTVTAGLNLFTSQILDRNWDPEGGASIKTYFVNACLLSFPNIYRYMKTREHRAAEPLDPYSVMELLDSAIQRIAVRDSYISGEADLINRTLASQPPEVRSVVSLVAEGFTAHETAEQLGTTPRAVEARLLRLRRALRAAKVAASGPAHELA